MACGGLGARRASPGPGRARVAAPAEPRAGRPSAEPPWTQRGIEALAGFPAEIWSVAASPKRVEGLRWRLRSLRGEEEAVRRELQASAAQCCEYAAYTEASRSEIRRLQGEEAAAAAGGSDLTVPLQDLGRLRSEVVELAEEVARTASGHALRSGAVRGMRAFARLVRLRRGAQAAGAELKCARSQVAEAQEEAQAVAEAAASLRARASGLRREVVALEAETQALAASTSEQDASAALAHAAACGELASAEQRTRQARHSGFLEAEVQARIGHEVEELAAQLLESESCARRLGAAIRRVDGGPRLAAEGAGLASPPRDSAGAALLLELRARAEAAAAARRWAEAELREQRGATSAWWASAEGLASDHREVAEGLTEELWRR